MRERSASACAVLRRRAYACSCSRAASLNTNSAFGLPAIAYSLSPKHSASDHQGVKQFNELLTHYTSHSFRYAIFSFATSSLDMAVLLIYSTEV